MISSRDAEYQLFNPDDSRNLLVTRYKWLQLVFISVKFCFFLFHHLCQIALTCVIKTNLIVLTARIIVDGCRDKSIPADETARGQYTQFTFADEPCVYARSIKSAWSMMVIAFPRLKPAQRPNHFALYRPHRPVALFSPATNFRTKNWFKNNRILNYTNNYQLKYHKLCFAHF